MPPTPLPIDEHLSAVVAAVERAGALVLVAPPGAGKTTRVPPALLDAGPLILLQPRRVAARALARRIAAERKWRIGREIGWQVRFERRFSRQTRLLVATEGVLVARLQGDPLLSDFRTVVLDEFHERTVDADLALALVREARRARGDLRIVVMSATLDAGPIAEYLGGCPVISVETRSHPVRIDHATGTGLGAAVLEALAGSDGHLLAFLPGAPEIERAARELRPQLPPDTDLLPLHGSLPVAAQERALASSPRRKVILATNIAETSLTVEGVRLVVDGGLHKLPRLDPALGIDRLETERISRDSADQRAGRAGRTGPGRVVRLWDPRDELSPRREPEIRRVDLASPLLAILGQGIDAATFPWFEAPEQETLQAALAGLERLGATAGGRLTELGRRLRRLPLPPRVGRVLLGCGGDPRAAAACAILAEGWSSGGPPVATACDLLPDVDRIHQAPPRVRRAAEQLERLASKGGFDVALPFEEALCRAVLAAYPDRVAQRREGGSRRLRMAGGHGALQVESSGVAEGEFLVAFELRAAPRGAGAEARALRVARIEREWLAPTDSAVDHELDPRSGKVRAWRRELYETLVLTERPEEPDPDRAATMLRDAMLERGLGDKVAALLARARFAGIEPDLPELLLAACVGRDGWFEFDLEDWLPPAERRRLAREAPPDLPVPSGRRVRLDYRDDGSVVASVKLQELFGLAESPRLGARREPVTFSLLAPNGRPVQTTRDLRSFWDRGYPEVRRELRGRYPKHPWPEDPWTAQPTGRAKRRR